VVRRLWLRILPIPARVKIPDKLPVSGLDKESRIKINQILDYLRATQVLGSSTITIDKTPDGVFVRSSNGGSGDGQSNVPKWG